uniref:Uncharacterized protein G9-4 n=1 Tax=Musa acuminata TaxID=4641 RepID=Q6RZW1_MUSAC|nr:hypothetical protein kinase [Musa acuminata]
MGSRNWQTSVLGRDTATWRASDAQNERYCVRYQSVHAAGRRSLLRRPSVAPLSRLTRPHRNPVRSYSHISTSAASNGNPVPISRPQKRKNGPSPFLLLVFVGSALLSSAAKLGERCSADQDCDGDLGVCVSIQPYDPRSKDLPFNKYWWQTTHDSFANAAAHSATGATLITFTNQQDDITSQLNVRFFALSHIHLCFRILFPRRGLYASPELSASYTTRGPRKCL